jgi:hypothetical protein
MNDIIIFYSNKMFVAPWGCLFYKNVYDIRMLAYVVVADALDECYHMGENITNK